MEAGESQEGHPFWKNDSETDYVLGNQLEIEADFVALAAAIGGGCRRRSKETSQAQFKVSLGQAGRLLPGSTCQITPCRVCGGRRSSAGWRTPSISPETINQAYGAAGRVLTLLSHDTVVASGSVCEVNEKKCMGCGTCAAVCTYGSIEMRKTANGMKAIVNPILCKGDGLCNAKCPTGAIQLKHFTDKGLLAQIDAMVPYK